MPEGPVGGPRPFVSQSCELVYFIHGVGRPTNSEILEIQEKLSSVRYVDHNKTLVRPGREARRSNALDVALVLQKPISMDNIERSGGSAETIVGDYVTRISGSMLTAGDPDDIIERREGIRF